MIYLHFFPSFPHPQLKCIARVHDIYEESAERSIEEDVPNVNVLASGSSSHNINSYQSYDHPQDGELSSDQNGLYLTHQKGKWNESFPFFQLLPIEVLHCLPKSLKKHNRKLGKINLEGG